MKKLFRCSVLLLFILTSLNGCSTQKGAISSISIVYGVAAFISLVLLIGVCLIVRDKKAWFVTLFSSVLVVNFGYTLLSVSTSLEMALNANRISYLGSVFLPMSMLMIILGATNTKYRAYLKYILIALAAVVFLIAASPGILDIYYKEVSFEVRDGVAMLIKVYGPLHPLYMAYLFGYFAVMAGVIIRASVKKTIDTTSHAIVLLIAVLVNIGVWFIEQIADIDFEMLSVSYIISELFLLGVNLVMKENERLRDIVRTVDSMQTVSEADSPMAEVTFNTAPSIWALDNARLEMFVDGIEKLTVTEKAIFEAYTARLTTKEIMAQLNIKENTLKFHNKNIYSKLGVSSRKELQTIYSQLAAAKAKCEENK